MIRDGEVYKEPRYVTDVITDNALRFLEQQKEDEKPFYLSVHYTAPHTPWTRENHPPELFDSYRLGCDFESVPWGLTPPEWVEHLSIPVENEEKRRMCLSGYFTAVTAMDGNIARILEWLEGNGLRGNTLIVFTADNGMNMGHHGVFGKGNATWPLNMWEESVKVPFIVSRPGSVPQGVVRSELLSQYDFMPTLLDYAGVGAAESGGLPGRSFAPLLRGDEQNGHDRVVVFDEYGPVRMIRTREWKYVHRYPDGPYELYDLVNDPGETRDLVSDAGQEGRVEEMRESLAEWFARYVNPEIDGTREGVTGLGQLGWAGKGMYFERR
jgi:arylsulfatase A-like enzyme